MVAIERLAEIANLAVVEGFQVKDIAFQLGISQASVRAAMNSPQYKKIQDTTESEAIAASRAWLEKKRAAAEKDPCIGTKWQRDAILFAISLEKQCEVAEKLGAELIRRAADRIQDLPDEAMTFETAIKLLTQGMELQDTANSNRAKLLGLEKLIKNQLDQNKKAAT